MNEAKADAGVHIIASTISIRWLLGSNSAFRIAMSLLLALLATPSLEVH